MKQPQPNPDYEGAENYMLHKLSNELLPELFYHGVHHTLYVMKAAMIITDYEKIKKEERKILRVAIAFHDAGFISAYHGHEEKSCELVKEVLPNFGFSIVQINFICKLIDSTKIPQSPQTVLEKIICDADLFYLGSNDAAAVAGTLFEELKLRGEVKTIKEWNLRQINFLQAHRYHTNYAIKYLQQNKETYLQRLITQN